MDCGFIDSVNVRLGVRSDFRSGFSAADGAEHPLVLCHGITPKKYFLHVQIPQQLLEVRQRKKKRAKYL